MAAVSWLLSDEFHQLLCSLLFRYVNINPVWIVMFDFIRTYSVDDFLSNENLFTIKITNQNLLFHSRIFHTARNTAIVRVCTSTSLCPPLQLSPLHRQS